VVHEILLKFAEAKISIFTDIFFEESRHKTCCLLLNIGMKKFLRYIAILFRFR